MKEKFLDAMWCFELLAADGFSRTDGQKNHPRDDGGGQKKEVFTMFVRGHGCPFIARQPGQLPPSPFSAITVPETKALNSPAIYYAGKTCGPALNPT